MTDWPEVWVTVAGIRYKSPAYAGVVVSPIEQEGPPIMAGLLCIQR